ncbi:MAG: hypothetical protein K9M96_09085 [Deltaproteobacteria bacterium]|nr:hypothetical protein [Deltaproteobacteria bacterium]
MGVLLFSSTMGKAEYKVRRILRQLGQDVEGFRSIKRLFMRFEQPRGDIRVIILLIPDHHTLNELIAMRDLIYDLPVVLSLPDSRRETLLKGHKFYPRFIMFTDGDYAGFAEALQNIIHREGMLFHTTMVSGISEGLWLG